MIVPNQFFDVKVANTTRKYFRELGYSGVNVGDTITVPLEHLNKANESKIKIECDMCGEIYETTYRNFKKYINPIKHYCKKCSLKARLYDKYGVLYAMHIEQFKEKMKQTRIDRYDGWYSQESIDKCRQTKISIYGNEYGKIAKKKAEQTCVERYGVKNPMESLDILNKSKKTVLDKYGVDNILKHPIIKKKVLNTLIERYGVTSPLMHPEFANKARQTASKNKTEKSSKQQMMVFDMIGKLYKNCNIFLNYSFRSFNFDIAIISNILNFKIDVEYDGQYWHKDAQRDRRRDEISKSYGWKVLRIKSGHKIPTKEQLIEAIDKLVNGYSYVEIKLDDWRDSNE